jgi:hypothetical protein
MHGGGTALTHMVVVDGLDGLGRVMIRDPWAGGSTYRMLRSDFEAIWTGGVVFR